MVEFRSAPGFPNLPNRAIIFGNLSLDTNGILTRDSEVIHLPPKELAALKLLLAHAGQIVSHQQLKQALWGDVHVTDDSVPKCMSSLRELLSPDDYIQTVYKRGYRLAVEVSKRVAGMGEHRGRLVIMPMAVEPNVPVYLGSAVSEETIALLTADRLAPVQVLARDSAFSLDARGMTAHQVGQALDADLVLTGKIRSLPSHFRLRVEMIRVADGTQIWVEDMLVSHNRVAGLELELAHRLYVRLSDYDAFQPTPGTKPESGAEPPGRREAYELFLQGHHKWQTLQRHRMEEAIPDLTRAIELDPSLYTAHIDLANASVIEAFAGFLSPAQAAEQIRKAAEAVPTSVEGAEAVLPALGWIRFHVDHDLPGALRAFATTTHLPHETSITRIRSMFALSRRRFLEAIELIDDALHSDPYSPWLNGRLAWAYHLSGEMEKSVDQAKHALEIFPDHEATNFYGAIILGFNGKIEPAIAAAENLIKRSPYFDSGIAVYGSILAQAGRVDEARSILERLQWLSRERFMLRSFTSAIYTALGEPDNAILELQAAAEVRCPWFFQMLADPRLASLRAHPGFTKLEDILDRMERSTEKKAATEPQE